MPMWPALLLSLAAVPLPPLSGQIAFMREGRVWVIGADGSGERALTGTLFYKTERPITWSPDGQRVLFWNHSKVGWDIWTVTVDGKESVNLTKVTSGGCRSPAPSPDGKRIAFLRDNPEGLYLMDADGSNQRRLADKAFRDFPPTWSPDGKRIAYTLLEESRFSIAYHDLASRKTVRVVSGAASPAWSPDGSRLLFVRFQKKTVTLGLISPDGSNDIGLTKGPGEARDPAWSPDGGRVAWFRSRDGKTELWVVTADGKTEKMLAAVEGRWTSAAPSWSPDGKWLTFAAGPAQKEVVYVVDEQGGGLRKLATGGACYPVWRPDSRDGGRP
jgi:TolB protein